MSCAHIKHVSSTLVHNGKQTSLGNLIYVANKDCTP